jgi:uncharacterized protein with PQ loop repeat
MCDNDKTTDIVGYSGGIILSICLIPQIYTIIKTKYVDNISYIWQFMYIIGISLHLYYSIYYNLLPIFIPTIIELCLILFLLILKIIYNKKDIQTQVDKI